MKQIRAITLGTKPRWFQILHKPITGQLFGRMWFHYSLGLNSPKRFTNLLMESMSLILNIWVPWSPSDHTGPKVSVSSIGDDVIRTREIFVKQRQWKEDKKSLALPSELSFILIKRQNYSNVFFELHFAHNQRFLPRGKEKTCSTAKKSVFA